MSFQKKLLSAKSLPISKPIELPSYRCINDFTASDKLEMSVQKNVMVKVLQKHDNGLSDALQRKGNEFVCLFRLVVRPERRSARIRSGSVPSTV